jgi:hypothetical protein
MARGLSATIQSTLAGRSQIRVSLISIETASTTNYFTNANFNIDYGGNTYQAQANFLSVTDTEENAELIITSCTIALSALDIANITTYANSGIINKEVIIYSAYLDSNMSIIGTPIIMFKGKITGYTISDARNTATIGLEVSSSFANFEKTVGRRTNEGNFRIEHPTDRSMEKSHESIADIKWGRT